MPTSVKTKAIVFRCLFIVNLCALFSCKTPSFASKNFEIEGTVKGLKSGSVKLVGYDYDGFESVVKESHISNGIFHLKGKTKGVTESYLLIDSTYEAFLFIEPKKLDVQLDVSKVIAEDFYKIIEPIVSGSNTNQLHQDYLKLEDSIHELPEFVALQQWYDIKLEKDLKGEHYHYTEAILLSKKQLDIKINLLRMNFALKNSHSIVAPYILLNEGCGFGINTYSISEMQQLCNSFNKEIKNNPYALECESIYKSDKRFSPGQIAPDFKLQSIDGNKTTLNSFKGKYVLLYFWTHWCGNCTHSFSNLKKLYNTYSDKGFEIVGISDDPEIEVWKSTVKEFQLPWPQLIVNKQSDISSLYDLKFLPTLFLLDKDGKILKKDLSIAALEKQLSVLLDEKE